MGDKVFSKRRSMMVGVFFAAAVFIAAVSGVWLAFDGEATGVSYISLKKINQGIKIDIHEIVYEKSRPADDTVEEAFEECVSQVFRIAGEGCRVGCCVYFLRDTSKWAYLTTEDEVLPVFAFEYSREGRRYIVVFGNNSHILYDGDVLANDVAEFNLQSQKYVRYKSGVLEN